jgi:hypothetical protein
LWRPVSRMQGQYSRSALEETLTQAGFGGIRVEPTLAGLGLLASATR